MPPTLQPPPAPDRPPATVAVTALIPRAAARLVESLAKHHNVDAAKLAGQLLQRGIEEVEDRGGELRIQGPQAVLGGALST